MKHVLMVLATGAGLWFLWWEFLKPRERRVVGKWSGRVIRSFLVGLSLVVALLAFVSVTSWRIW